LEATEKKLRDYEAAQKAERNDRTRSFQPDPSLPTDTERVVLKKGAGQRKALNTLSGNTPDQMGAENGEVSKGFAFHGLKKYVPPPAEKPIDPFGGWSIDPQHYIMEDDYDVDWITKTKDDPSHVGGGYDMHEFYSRALCDAFSGFGVFIEDEISARENEVSGDANTGTISAAAIGVGGKDVNMDDIF
jgi:CDK-activating kinase assembly factor MAT1